MARVNPLGFLLRPYPTYYIFFVTGRCNCACPHCFYHKASASADKGSELSLDEYRALSARLGLVKAASITGGEPSLRDDVVEICEALAKGGGVEYLSFHTNGLLMEKIKGIARELVRRLPDTFIKFELSIDGLSGAHDRLRRSPGLFDGNMELIGYLASLKAGHKNLGIGVNTVYSSANKDSIGEIAAYCRKLPVDSYDVNFIRGDTGDPALRRVDPGEFFNAVKDLETRRELRGSGLALASWAGVVKEMRWSAIREAATRAAMPFPCVAGKKMLVVSEEGMVYPCELLGKPFGSLRDNGYDIRKLLASDTARRILADVRAKRCFCTWECAITCSIAHNPALYPEMFFRWLMKKAKGV
jgi:MoaA/NifB/PqqE/SkfB family radical SAM enzyme